MKKPNPIVPSYDFNECELQKALKRKDNIDHLGVILKASTILKAHRLENPVPQASQESAPSVPKAKP